MVTEKKKKSRSVSWKLTRSDITEESQRGYFTSEVCLGVYDGTEALMNYMYKATDRKVSKLVDNNRKCN